jgi:hypothetical protein
VVGLHRENDRPVDPAIVAALITAAIAILVSVISVVIAFWSAHQQRAIDLVAAALSHMGGGVQERSAGVAALSALRGPLSRRPRRLSRGGWTIFGPAVGQQLFRQLIYVLNHAEKPYSAHEVENVLSMVDWLIQDHVLLDFNDGAQRRRLAVSLAKYVGAAPGGRSQELPASTYADTSTAALLGKASEWLGDLGGTGRPG